MLQRIRVNSLQHFEISCNIFVMLQECYSVHVFCCRKVADNARENVAGNGEVLQIIQLEFAATLLRHVAAQADFAV